MGDQVCAIVGAGGGLGQSIASAFAGRGYDVALVSRSEKGSADAMEGARKANGSAKVGWIAGDATKPETIEAALGKAISDFGRVDVLVYNVRPDMNFKPPLAMEYDEVRAIVDVEVTGALAAAKAVMPAMIERKKGTVIFSSATAAFRGSPTNALYAIGKFALRALAQSLAKAHNKDGVHVAHVRLDCALDVPIVRQFMGDKFDPKMTANTDDVAKSYLWLVDQPKSAWSNEIELRPYTEEWTF